MIAHAFARSWAMRTGPTILIASRHDVPPCIPCVSFARCWLSLMARP